MISGSVFTFQIIEVEPGSVTVAPGERVTLYVKTDGHYEWCKFFSPDPRGGMYCDFEWKYNQGNITMQDCPLHARVEFHGKYDDKHCGITFTADLEDRGEWRVEIEEYVTLGSRGSGHLEKATFKVKVAASTPKPTTTTSAPAEIPPLTFMNPKTTTTTPITTTTTITTQSTTPMTTGTKTTVTQTESTTTTKTITTTSEISTDKPIIRTDPTSTTMGNIDNNDDSPKAVPLADDHTSSSSSGVVVGVIIVLLVVIVTISGVFYYRRRRAGSVVSVEYDQTGMVESGAPGVTITTTGGETSNLHEYYPPNLNGYNASSTS